MSQSSADTASPGRDKGVTVTSRTKTRTKLNSQNADMSDFDLEAA